MAKGAHCRSQHSHSGVSGGGQWPEKPLCWFTFLSGFILFLKPLEETAFLGRVVCPGDWHIHLDWLFRRGWRPVFVLSLRERCLWDRNPIKLGLLEPDIAGYQLITCLKVQDGPWGQGCDLGMTWILFSTIGSWVPDVGFTGCLVQGRAWTLSPSKPKSILLCSEWPLLHSYIRTGIGIC